MTTAQVDDLTFDPVKHEYRLGGVVIPNVTGILRDAGFVDATWYTDWSREKGSAIHRACQYLDEGDLKWASLDPRIHEYVAAWHRYTAENDIEVVEVERMVLSRVHFYAGTLDRIVTRRRTGRLALVDIKSGAKNDVTGIQLAAYARAWLEETGQAITDRVGVYVREDGTYEAVPYPATDWQHFEAALRVMKWRRAHGK